MKCFRVTGFIMKPCSRYENRLPENASHNLATGLVGEPSTGATIAIPRAYFEDST